MRKDSDVGENWGQEEKGRSQRVRWLDDIIDSMDMSLSILEDGEGQERLVWGRKEVDTI